MKLSSWSRFLRWAAGEQEVPPEGSASGQPSQSGDFESSAAAAVSTQSPQPATSAWLDAGGQLVRCRARLRRASDGALSLHLAQAVEPGALVWLLSDEGAGLTAVVRSCEPVEGGCHASIQPLAAPADSAVPEDARLGEATWVWAGPDHQLQSGFVAIGNSGDGLLTVESPDELPSPSIVLLKGHEYRCLGFARFYRTEGQRHVFEVETMSDALRSPAQAAA